MKQGGKLLLVGVFLVPILALLTLIVGDGGEEIILLGVIVAILGIMRLLYALIFQDGHPAAAPFAQMPAAAPQFNPAARHTALPPQQSAPAPVSFRARDTGELAGRPSVTENTTRLLDHPAEPREQ
jgi:hypothetical protein